VSDKEHTFTFPAAERPKMVRFDPGDWILKELDFERTREQLLYQLEFAGDVAGRIEAAQELRKFTGAQIVQAKLLERLDAEPFWGVRSQIALTLSELKEESVTRGLTLRLEREPKSQVRRKIVTALGEAEGDGCAGTLRNVISRDPSYYVVADALKALGQVDAAEARPDAVAALALPSHREVIRVAAVEVLAMDDSMTAEVQKDFVERLVSLASPANPLPVRLAAFRALGKAGKGTDDALHALTEALEKSDVVIRWEAIEALGDLGDQRAVVALERRRAVETPVVFRDPLEAISKALDRIAGKADVDDLKKEVRDLRARLETLEKRSN
jgi:HEAT repeat protein